LFWRLFHLDLPPLRHREITSAGLFISAMKVVHRGCVTSKPPVLTIAPARPSPATLRDVRRRVVGDAMNARSPHHHRSGFSPGSASESGL